ncbi:MAG: MDR family MFS transporter [Burkholderiaceae bacterium]
MFLSAIDQTIVSVSLLTIASELGGISLMAWVVSGYLVASTVATPLYGKLSDLYGRRRLMNISIAMTLGGSILCALAQSMPQLVLFRVVQGLGGGGLMALSQTIVADVAPGRERGRYQGYFSGVFATAAVVGPMLGGYLTHYLSWRAVFWINLPIALGALLLSNRALALLPVHRQRRGIDYAGALLLSGGLATLLIALTRIGQGIAWLAPSTLALLAAALVLLVLCGWVETKVEEPILPPAIMANRTVLLCCAILALNFFLLIGSSVLLPLALQATERATADRVALKLLPMTISIPFGAFLSGRLMMRQIGFDRLLMVGSLLSALAMAAIAYTPFTMHALLAFEMLVMGVGLGLPMPAALVASQLAVRREQVGIATGATAFFRTLGGAIGIAILTSMLMAAMRESAPAGATMQTVLASSSTDPAVLREAFAKVFLVAAVAPVLGFVLAMGLGRRLPAV